MVKRINRKAEKEEILDKLKEYGLKKDDIEHLETEKLRKTLHVIRKEMKDISNDNVRIVILDSKKYNDTDSECSYCDTDDSECSYCDTDDTEISIETIHNNSDASDYSD